MDERLLRERMSGLWLRGQRPGKNAREALKHLSATTLLPVWQVQPRTSGHDTHGLFHRSQLVD
jgi:hypothetical protein